MDRVLSTFQRLLKRYCYWYCFSGHLKTKYSTDLAVFKAWHYKCKTNWYSPFNFGLFLDIIFGGFIVVDFEVTSSMIF